MEMTFIEKLAFYVGIDYHSVRDFLRQYLSMRGIAYKVPFSIPPAPRHFIRVPLNDDFNISKYRWNSSCSSLSSIDEVDVHIEGSLETQNNSVHNKNILLNSKIDRNNELLFKRIDDEDIDAGFYSDSNAPSADGETIQMIGELRLKIEEMQKAMMYLVENQQKNSFTPLSFSSPVSKSKSSECKLIVPVAPPPPPPPTIQAPPPPTPLILKQIKKDLNAKDQIPNMLDVLKDMKNIKLKPVQNKHNNFESTKNEGREFIANILREHCKNRRYYVSDDAKSFNNSFEWSEEESQSDMRCLLRKVDRSKLPKIVSEELSITDD